MLRQAQSDTWLCAYSPGEQVVGNGSICYKMPFVQGTVTRSSEVRPELYLATFTCLECQHEVANVQQQYKFTQPLICPNETCGNRWARAQLQQPAGCTPIDNDIFHAAAM